MRKLRIMIKYDKFWKDEVKMETENNYIEDVYRAKRIKTKRNKISELWMSMHEMLNK